MQGDPISPFLFIIAAKAVEAMMKEAILAKIYKGIQMVSESGTISHLQFADYTLFLDQWSFINVQNLFSLQNCFNKLFVSK